MTKKNQNKVKITVQSKKTTKKRKQKQKLVLGHPQAPLRVQECTYKYMLAKTDPWSPNAAGACVPIDNMVMSQKNHAFLRQTITIGLNGYAYVAISPCLANNTPCIYVTTNNYNIASSGVINIAAGIATVPAQITTQSLPTPYTASQLLDGGLPSVPSAVKGRIVSAGFKFWYSGTELNRSGWMAPFVSPQHGTLEGYSIDGLLSWQTTNVIPTTSSRKHQACVFGIKDTEFAYAVTPVNQTISFDSVASNYPYSSNVEVSANTANGAPIAIVMFKGVAGQTYEFEYCQHSEYVGQPCVFAATKNSSDPQGATLVNEAIQAVNDDPAQETTTENVIRKMRELVVEHSSHLVDLGLAAGKAYMKSRSASRPQYSMLMNG